jgi:hypothetical protein
MIALDTGLLIRSAASGRDLSEPDITQAMKVAIGH